MQNIYMFLFFLTFQFKRFYLKTCKKYCIASGHEEAQVDLSRPPSLLKLIELIKEATRKEIKQFHILFYPLVFNNNINRY